ncbi:MAG: Type 1 glutamine amidotransferase-like domain-containing protein [Campylobacter sp.]|nr:Type 1 glutamine amidotransferase-like domain-containing protein [Campylobacter sp.]
MKEQRRSFVKIAALGAGIAMVGGMNLSAKEKAFPIKKRDHAKQKALLLSSSGYKDTPYLSHAVEWIGKFAKENNLAGKKIVFIPYASLRRSYDEYENKVKEALASLNLNIVGVHHAKNAA